MKIAIIIKDYQINSYENTQFRKNCSKLGISVEFLIDSYLSLFISTNKKVVMYKDSILNCDVVLPRCGSSTTERLALIIDVLKEQGKLVINDGKSISLMKDKLATLNFLASKDINVINTVIINSQDNLDDITKFINYPIVKKVNTGSYGEGIYLINDFKQLKDFFEFSKLTNTSDRFIFQEFINHKFGEDIRVYMFRDKVIGAMRRKSDGVDFKANYTIHKNSESVIVSNELLLMCQKIMAEMKCDIAGIDILETKDGYVVCEVNSAPGFIGMEETNTGLNVAKELLKNIKNVYNKK